MSRRVRGFTLVELLVVMGLLGAFSYMAFRLLSGGLTVWKITEESRDQDERARVVLEMLRRDLAQVESSVRARFVVDYGAQGGVRLRFTRTIGSVEEARFLAGLDIGAAPAPSGGTRAEAPKEGPGATVGLAEVAYAALRDPASADAALQVVRRAVVPVRADGTTVSIFEKDFFARRADGFEARSAVLVGGVLYLGLELVSQRAGAMEHAWDSTRGEFLTPSMPEPNKFSLALAEPPSPRERVFPRRVRATLILEREENDQRVVRLAVPAEAGDRELTLDDPRPMPLAAGDAVKIGGEWMLAASAGPRVLRVQARGALGTLAVSHAAGAALHRGRTFVVEIPIATYRDADLR